MQVRMQPQMQPQLHRAASATVTCNWRDLKVDTNADFGEHREIFGTHVSDRNAKAERKWKVDAHEAKGWDKAQIKENQASDIESRGGSETEKGGHSVGDGA